jgi:transposase
MRAETLTRGEAEIARLLRAGMLVSDIAAQRGVKPGSISTMALRARSKGVDAPKRPNGGPERKVDYFTYARLAREGLCAREISRRLGVSEGTVGRALKVLREAGANVPAPPYKRIQAERRRRVVEMYAAGVKPPQMAVELDTNPTVIYRDIQALVAEGVIEPRPRRSIDRLQAPQEAEQDETQRLHTCMRCHRAGDADAPRYFLCTPCKNSEAACLPRGW